MNKLQILLFSLIASLLFTSCGGDDDGDTNPDVTGTLTWQFDGMDYTTTDIDATMSTSMIGDLDIRFLDITGIVDSAEISVSIQNVNNLESGSCLRLRAYDVMSDECEDAGGGVSVCEKGGADFELDNTSWNDFLQPGTVTLSACDSGAKRASGSFSVTLSTFSTGEEKEITGTFENIKYETF